MRTRLWIALFLASAASASLLLLLLPSGSPRPVPTPPADGIFSKSQLAQFDGANGAPVYLAMLGGVFDVSKGLKHYGAGGGYSFFAARDGSRAFITGVFNETGLVDDVSDFSAQQMKGLLEWRDFFGKEYVYVGKLIGAFYDEEGRPTEALARVEAGAVDADLDKRALKEEEKLHPTCNSKWSQKDGGKVWCSNGRYPRKKFVQQRGSDTKFRCACFEDQSFSEQRQVYKNCEPSMTTCITTPPPAQ